MNGRGAHCSVFFVKHSESKTPRNKKIIVSLACKLLKISQRNVQL